MITVCLTGVFEKPRKILITQLKEFGIIASDKATAAVNYLVMGKNPGMEKLQMAYDYDIPVITLSQLLHIASQSQNPDRNQSVVIKLSGYKISVAKAFQIARNYEIDITRESLTSQSVTVNYQHTNQFALFMFELGKNI